MGPAFFVSAGKIFVVAFVIGRLAGSIFDMAATICGLAALICTIE